MNERAIELYKEACEFAYDVCKQEGRTGGPGDHIWHTLSTGRFAELLINDCASLCEIQSRSYTYSFTPAKARLAESTAKHCATIIKRHFGVEL